MKIKLIWKDVLPDRKTSKVYAIPVNQGIVNLYDLSDEIAGRSSLTRGDVENVLSQFLDILPFHLKEGKTIDLGEFAKLRLGISSDGAKTEKEFHVSMIRRVRVIFTPSIRLKDTLKRTHFERIE